MPSFDQQRPGEPFAPNRTVAQRERDDPGAGGEDGLLTDPDADRFGEHQRPVGEPGGYRADGRARGEDPSPGDQRGLSKCSCSVRTMNRARLRNAPPVFSSALSSGVNPLSATRSARVRLQWL